MNILFIMPVDLNGQSGDSIRAKEIISNASKFIGSSTVLSCTDYKNKPAISGVKVKRIRLVRIPFLMGLSASCYIFTSSLYMLITSKYDFIYSMDPIFGAGCRLAKIFKIPSVLEINGLITYNLKMNKVLKKIVVKIESNTYSKADKIVVVSAGLKQTLQSVYNVPENKIAVIGNGANIELFKPMDIVESRKKLNLAQNNAYIGFVGNLAPWQGVEYFIKSTPEILDKHPNTRFLIIGDGVLKKKLVKLAEQIGTSDKFIFSGSIPYEKVPLYINATDVCVAPFLGSERNAKLGFSALKLFEYMACGKPLITTSVVEIKEEIIDNKTGIIIEPDNPTMLAKSIIYLLEHSTIRIQMGENGRKFVIERHSWDNVAKRVVDVCDGVLHDKKLTGLRS